MSDTGDTMSTQRAGKPSLPAPSALSPSDCAEPRTQPAVASDRPKAAAEAGHITLSVGLGSLSLVVMRSEVPIGFKVAAAAIYVLAGWAAALLYWSIFAARYPETAEQVGKRGSFSNIRGVLWITRHWLRLLVRSIHRIPADELTELGFLHLLGAIAVFWVAGAGLVLALLIGHA
jgi:hypothetical protein